METHTKQFYKASWRALKETIEYNKEQYSGQTKWDEYIKLAEAQAENLEQGLVTPEEKADFKAKIRRWPKMSQVIKRLEQKIQRSFPSSSIWMIGCIATCHPWLMRSPRIYGNERLLCREA
ncbi:MAG TPA: hypothetical protein VN951_07460 [Pyrinomonadaceae bacterium]|nr:hypothetical protein [Pyrinomonadaceae bacterium]